MDNLQITRGFPSTMGDDFQLNINDVLKYAARTYPEQEIVSREMDGTLFRYNYKMAYERVKKLANALEGLGIEPGDRIGALDWNSHRYFEMYNAIPGIGAVLLQINPRISMEERLYVINHSEAKFLILNESFIPIIEPIASRLESVKGYVIITDKDPVELKTTLEPVYSYERLLEVADTSYEWPMIDETSAYSACYTSGTTGKPKGVYYSHRAIYLHTYSFSLLLNITLHDCIMQTVPMYHASGWGLFFTAPLTGAKLVFPGMYSAEDPSVLVSLLVNEKVTVTSGAPAIFIPMLEYIKTLDPRPDLQGLRMPSGATEPPLSMMRGYHEFGGAEVIHVYGATETTPIITINLLKSSLQDLSMEEKWEIKKRQGLQVSGVDFKVVGPNGEEVPRDGETVGEILVRGPWITKSYYQDPRSAEAFVDGYWKSGDAATVDKNGYIKVTDRYKDLIKSGGEWISSIDLENTIMAHPGVLEASVVGIPHPKWQERPLALVVLRKDHQDKVDQEEIFEFLRPRFAKWQLPDQILFVEQIPKTSVGKFAKRIIREQYQDHYNE